VENIVLNVNEIEKIIENGSNENANLLYAPETIHKFIADMVIKQYSLKLFNNDIRKAHLKGDIHLHDLDYGALRPVCMQHDLRPYFKHGLKVDGTGIHTSISKPAKHAEVAIQHAAKVMMAAQTNMSGGQSIDEFNVWLAPYVKGLSYEEVKQLMQMFVYELNQMYVARGGQVIFSSINLEFNIPDYLKDKDAIRGGEVVGTYEEYNDEARMILEALVDVMLEGDMYGKMFLFPNTIFKIRDKKDFNDELYFEVHKLAAKYGTAYFINMIPDWQEINTNAMGCRTRLTANWTGDVEVDTLRTGNMQWYTINLPRIAYESRGNEEKIFEILYKRLEMLKDALLFKHELTKKRLYENHMMPFLTQKFDDEEYYRYDSTTKTIGFVGLNEMVKYVTGYDLHDDSKALEFGYKVIKFMRQFVDKCKEETGLRFTLTQTPAESTAGRFARLDWKYYKENCRTVVNGLEAKDINKLYYTNSSHCRVDAQVSLPKKVRTEEIFHPLTNGGHIMHLWLSDATNDNEVISDLTRNICLKTNTGFFVYTKDMTLCKKCSNLSYGLRDSCINCGSNEIEKYSRITGYLQRYSNFNSAKKKEVEDRKRYSL